MMREVEEPQALRIGCWNPGPEGVHSVRAVTKVVCRPGVRAGQRVGLRGHGGGEERWSDR